jgi:anti-sigma factor RsiW
MADHDCRHLLGDVSDFVEGEASAAICAEIERHLADCENCRVVVDTLRQTIKLYHALPQPSLPADARERLYRSLDLQAFLKPASR